MRLQRDFLWGFYLIKNDYIIQQRQRSSRTTQFMLTGIELLITLAQCVRETGFIIIRVNAARTILYAR